ncbi:MAG: DNA-binding response regulator [Bacteroidota bacterium]
MDKITCIAVDDEPLALVQMRDFIGRVPNLELKGCFSNGLETLAWLQSNKVDLIFLDIHMDDISGIKVLESMKSRPQVILTTAYDKYALKGFELDVCDYLLKPISFDRFVKAVQKAGTLIAARRNMSPNKEVAIQPSAEGDYIFIKCDYKICRIGLGEIQFIEGCKDYLKIRTASRSYMSLLSFKKLETLLPADEFIRVHRSFLVPLSKVGSIGKKWIQIDGFTIPLGDFYKQEFFKRINEQGIRSAGKVI